MTAVAVLVFVRLLDPSSPTGRLELIRTSLAVGAGTGAIMTLVLAWRRQWSTEHDAIERRLTDLYVKAVEQLGSDKAPVRHGALYALERVAQDNPDHRQTVVDVICAYLRAPYTPPPDTPAPRRTGVPASLRGTPATRVAVATAAARRISLHPPTPPPTPEDLRQEREVRLTAQRILSRHLHPGNRPRRPIHTFWPDINLDLTDATLINFDLSACHIGTGRFNGAKFTGDARFVGVEFTGNTWFDEAKFTGDAEFRGAEFAENAWFDKAEFTGDTAFSGAKLTGYAWFGGVEFTGNAWFNEAKFTRDAWFSEAKFTENAWFGGVEFARDAWFDEAEFTENAVFAEAKFTGDAWFDEAEFTENAVFAEAKFTGDAWFDEAEFNGNAWFDKAEFTGDTAFDKAEFENFAVMTGAKTRPRQSTWPTGWATTGDAAVADRTSSWLRLVPVPATLLSAHDDPTEAAE
ncbi:hypothetical protein GCM10027199_09300 [Amycolatopsis magusensis]